MTSVSAPPVSSSPSAEEPAEADSMELGDVEDSELLMVMDASGSMDEEDAQGEPRIEAARDSLHSVVDGLDDENSVGLRVFSSEITDPGDSDACEDSELAVDIAQDNREDLREAINDYEAIGGRTPLAYALEQAAEDFTVDGHRTIVLVSDGEENCVPDPCEVAESLASQGIDVAIHTVGFNVDDEAREQLQCIADAASGDYYDAEDVESLERALERLSQRAFQPFALQGEPVDGGTDRKGELPELQPGQYVDQWNEEALYYRIPRSVEGSSIHVGLSATHDEDTSFDPLVIALGTEEAQDWESYRGSTFFSNRELCDMTNLYEGTSEASLNVRSAQVTAFPGSHRAEDGDDDCGDDDELILMVEAVDRGDSNDYVGRPFEFVVTEESPVSNRGDLPEAATGNISDYDWQEMPMSETGQETILGGNSFNNAEPLEAGNVYDSEILPGESQVFRIPVDWGEHLQVQASAPPADEWAPEDNWAHSRGIALQIYSPERGQIQHSSQANGQEHKAYGQSSASDEEAVWQTLSHPVKWANREAGFGSGTDMKYASTAEEYYVLVSQNRPIVSADDARPMPFTILADTFGESGAGAPEYQDEADPERNAEEGASEETADAEDGTITDGDKDRDPSASTDESAEPSADAQNNWASAVGSTGITLGVGLAVILVMGIGILFVRMAIKRRE